MFLFLTYFIVFIIFIVCNLLLIKFKIYEIGQMVKKTE